MIENRYIQSSQSKKTNTLASILSRNSLLSPIRGSRKAVWGTPALQCQETNSLEDINKVHRTCSVLCFGICLYEGDRLIDLQAVPVVPFVLLVEVYSSILVGEIMSNDIHCSSLRCIVHRTAVAKRERKVVYRPFYWLPYAVSIEE